MDSERRGDYESESRARRAVYFGGDSRAASDVLGFVFIFGIIMATIGLVYATGFTGLQDARDFEQINNVERAFDVLADNIDDITRRDAPSRATEMKLAGGQLALGEPTVVAVRGEKVSNASQNFSYSYELLPIEYRDGEASLVYENGAVFRSSQGSSVMVREPDFLLTDERTVVPIVQTRNYDAGQIGGSSTIMIRVDHSKSTLLEGRTDEPYNLWLNVTSPHADAWARHLDTKPDVDCDPVDENETASCRLDGVDRVYVTIGRLDVSFE